MWRTHSTWTPTAILLLLLVCLALGGGGASRLLIGSGSVGLGYLALRLAGSRRWHRFASVVTEAAPSPRPAKPADRPAPADPNDPNALVDEMLAQGRDALLLRPQITANLSPSQFRLVLASLNDNMALVPEGDVVLGPAGEQFEPYRPEPGDEEPYAGRVVRVAPVFLDRYPVTNRQFYEFVACGGYEQVALWDASVWTAVLAMTDRTGKPGPRYWIDGIYLEGEADHPVVGVSWYEAAAFARWAGKRLPSDAEWVKAGAWPLPAGGTAHGQRRYPWGDTIDRTKANLWGSGPERIVSVQEFADGVSVGGVYQLIGNVWEWTGGNFRGIDGPGGRLAPAEPMKSLRGGAFDTYFDNQATCQFQSGDSPLRRKHNIGFRCAVGLCDLVLARPEAAIRHTGAGPAKPPGEEPAEPAPNEPTEPAQEICV